MAGRAPLHGVITLGHGGLATTAARKSGCSGASFYARKSDYPGGGAFPLPGSGGDEEDDEELGSSEEEGDSHEEGKSGEESEDGEGGDEEGEPATVAAALRAALAAAEAPGDFATGGQLSLRLPGLELVDSSTGSASVIGLPLSESAAADVKAACQLAPFGRRDRTLQDTKGPHYFEDLHPDGEEQESDTGNEGAPCSRWYRRTALVAWPKSRRFDLWCAGGVKPATEGLLQAVRKRSQPPAVLHEWAAAVLRALPGAADPGLLSAALAAVAELGDAQLAEQCLAAVSKAGTLSFGYRSAHPGNASCVTAEHATAIVQLCQLGGWSAECRSALELLLARLAQGGLDALPSCAALLQQLHAVATAPGAAVAVAGAGAAAPAPAAANIAAGGAAAALAARAQPGGGSSSGQAAAAGVFSAGLALVTQAVASLARADAPTQSYMGAYDVSRQREAQARAAAGLAQLLGLVQEAGGEAAAERFLASAFARHFIAAGPAAGDGGGGGAGAGSGGSHSCMLPALLAACQRFGWASLRSAGVLTATAAACGANPGGCGDFLELARGVQAAAGGAALVPQLTAAYLQALSAAPPPNSHNSCWHEGPLVRALLAWLAEQGSPQHLGAFFARAATSTLSLQAAVDLALRLGGAKGWWADVQQGLLAAFGRAHSERDMPAVLDQLRRVREATGVDGGAAVSGTAVSGTAARGDGVQCYLQLAAAVVGALEGEADRDINPPRRPAVSYYRGRRYKSATYYSTPSTPPRTATFVRDLLLAAYVPGCRDSAQLLARVAAHVCRRPLRYPVDSLVLPALEGVAAQLQLGSLAAAVQAVPALRPMSSYGCPALRAFLEHAQHSEQRFALGAARRKHLASALGRAGAIPGFNWRDDGAAIVCSKRGIYEAALAEYGKHASWQKLQVALGAGAQAAPAGGARAGSGGGTSGAACSEAAAAAAAAAAPADAAAAAAAPADAAAAAAAPADAAAAAAAPADAAAAAAAPADAAAAAGCWCGGCD